MAVVRVIDDEADFSRAREQQHDRVNEADVIWQEQEATLRQMFMACRSDAINEARDGVPDGEKGAFAKGGMRHVFMIYIQRSAHCNRQFR